MTDGNDLTLEFQSTAQVWVAYRGCGCADCHKGIGKTQEEAIADLRETIANSPNATSDEGGK
jgi:hypothetical protein